MESNDTDTLVALVFSLLTDIRPDPDTVLEALVQCNGDVETTAKLLNGSGTEDVKVKKRKRIGLDAWLSKPSKVVKASCSTQLEESEPHIQAQASESKVETSNPSTLRRVPITDLMSVLKPPPSPTNKKPTQLPPLLLTSPEMVAQNTPCTMHLSILPPELACRLFYSMIDSSRSWSRNKWWLVDRMVESPHRTAFFARKDSEAMQEAAQHWYNGRMTETPALFPPAMEEACEIVERIVNEQLKSRSHFPLEWDAGSWRANVAASNCYNGSKESVGFHSDQLTYLGPYPTIASLSLERFKHSIPPQPAIDIYHPAFPETPGGVIEPSKCRINITFRFYRPDFAPASIPRCKCGIPTVLRPDMKNRSDGKADRYWWACYAGAQNDGKGCNFWKIMDMNAEGRGSSTSNRLDPPAKHGQK
ncbi:hypothetical protein C0991_009745 [Blastosporella zonata]|nr:hypothetical protein C0991_009745 [Blastosporella zonata]